MYVVCVVNVEIGYVPLVSRYEKREQNWELPYAFRAHSKVPLSFVNTPSQTIWEMEGGIGAVEVIV